MTGLPRQLRLGTSNPRPLRYLLGEAEEVEEALGLKGVDNDAPPLPPRLYEASGFEALYVAPHRGNVYWDAAGQIRMATGILEKAQQNLDTLGVREGGEDEGYAVRVHFRHVLLRYAKVIRVAAQM